MFPILIVSSKKGWTEPLNTRPTQMSRCPLSQSNPPAVSGYIQIAIKKIVNVPMSPVPISTISIRLIQNQAGFKSPSKKPQMSQIPCRNQPHLCYSEIRWIRITIKKPQMSQVPATFLLVAAFVGARFIAPQDWVTAIHHNRHHQKKSQMSQVPNVPALQFL